MSFAVGSLVRARGREWVVLPESEQDLLVLRPLGGTEDEVTGILESLETVTPATFVLPDPGQLGDYRSSRLLRDAVRLGFRSSAGPFRSFGQIAVDPRPYQLVPLLMALKLDPVRLLIADDVGIGKTIEAALVARELLDRGEVKRLAVLCPPHLAEQWQAELRDKFHIAAELVLPGTATRLERARRRVDETIFDLFPFVIVSTDFIKAERRRNEFLRSCPELVIVDEAHTCVAGAGEGRGGRHQRYELVKALSRNPDRHLVLVTATPHSGNEEAFRSLLALLKPEFADLPVDLTGPQAEPQRRRLAAHFVQRRRGDIRRYMEKETPFPRRVEGEMTYRLTPEYRALFERVLRYAREVVLDESGGRHRQRVRWWSALALLRSLASSPAAAAATLRARAAVADTETDADADDLGRRTVLDMEPDDSVEVVDVVPGSDTEPDAAGETAVRRRLRAMAREADALFGDPDAKLKDITKFVRDLVAEGGRPILFCRFIPTAEYVAAELRSRLRGVEVAAVTGTLAPAEREERVQQLAQHEKRVLVCTDCLSEGVNLQEHFDSVIHYDLSWNPTRHEQREGRVDRYGQPKETVQVVTYYGVDNQIDGIVLDILLRKHKAIRNSLGVSVPVPADSSAVVEAILEGLLLRGAGASSRSASASTTATASSADQLILFEDDEILQTQKRDLYRQWDAAEVRERRSRTVFAQESIRVDEVARELDAVRSAIGAGVDVSRFAATAVRAFRGVVTERGVAAARFDLTESPRALREAVGLATSKAPVLDARFDLPLTRDSEKYLSRTHPFVEGLATYVLETALDALISGGETAPGAAAPPFVARRCGAMHTDAVTTRTTLLLVRFRFHILTRQQHGPGGAPREWPLLAEDCQTLAFTGSPQNAVWLPSSDADSLLTVEPTRNVLPEVARQRLEQVIGAYDGVLLPRLVEAAEARAAELLDAHRRVRAASGAKGLTYRVEPQLPPDVLGVYVLLPAG